MRKAKIKRKTNETDIEIRLNLDGSGKSDIVTGIGFLDHMLATLSRHSGIDIRLSAEGDLHVDEHHVIEDVGICLGMALKQSLGDKKGISRFGYAIVPMDEAVSMVGVDISGRGYANIAINPSGKVGGISMDNFLHFFETVCRESGINMFAEVKGKNAHHMIESLFKAFAVSLREAVRITGSDVPSVKGVI